MQVLMFALVVLAALGLIVLGVLQIRRGTGGRAYANASGQDNVAAFMIDTGIVLLVVPLIAFFFWLRRTLPLREVRRQRRRRHRRPR